MRTTTSIVIRSLAALALACLLLPTGAAAQSRDADPTDLRFAIVNGTTGEPGAVDRLTIHYMRNRANGILDMEPDGAEFTAPAVPLRSGGEYLITAWFADVPYWWLKRGHQLGGEVTTLHVFDTTFASDGVVIAGLNVVARRVGGLLNIEYMLQVENRRQPQETVSGGGATLSLQFPAGAGQIEANYRRGPEPTMIDAEAVGRRLALTVPLTPGNNRVQVTASVPWQDGLILPVGANVPIESWSLLTAPEWLVVTGTELESGITNVPGFTRHIGPALADGRRFEVRLSGDDGAPADTTDLFTRVTEAEAATGAGPGESSSGRSVLPFVFGAVLIIIIVTAAARRRR